MRGGPLLLRARAPSMLRQPRAPGLPSARPRPPCTPFSPARSRLPCARSHSLPASLSFRAPLPCARLLPLRVFPSPARAHFLRAPLGSKAPRLRAPLLRDEEPAAGAAAPGFPSRREREEEGARPHTEPGFHPDWWQVGSARLPAGPQTVPAPGLWRRRAGAEVSGARAAGRLWVCGQGMVLGRPVQRGSRGSVPPAGPEPEPGRTLGSPPPPPPRGHPAPPRQAGSKFVALRGAATRSAKPVLLRGSQDRPLNPGAASCRHPPGGARPGPALLGQRSRSEDGELGCGARDLGRGQRSRGDSGVGTRGFPGARLASHPPGPRSGTRPCNPLCPGSWGWVRFIPRHLGGICSFLWKRGLLGSSRDPDSADAPGSPLTPSHRRPGSGGRGPRVRVPPVVRVCVFWL